jgi:hypothetical protein
MLQKVWRKVSQVSACAALVYRRQPAAPAGGRREKAAAGAQVSDSASRHAGGPCWVIRLPAARKPSRRQRPAAEAAMVAAHKAAGGLDYAGEFSLRVEH